MLNLNLFLNFFISYFKIQKTNVCVDCCVGFVQKVWVVRNIT